MSERTFELKEEHVKLLSAAHWRWEDCEYGAPAMDCKRPFGNSDVVTDIMEILDIEPKVCPHCGESLDESERDKYAELYRELETAIQVVFDALSFSPGIYEQIPVGYKSKWQKVAA